jgi:hypothetical protein
MKSSLSNSKKIKKTIITKKIKLKREFLSPKVINRIKNVFFLTQQKLIQNNNERENTIKTTRKNDDKLDNKIIITNKKHILNDKMPEILNKCKSKLFYNDYSYNKKLDLTSVIKGLNIIKDIYFKKLKKIFSSIKMINIYKRKIVKSKSPKGRINKTEIKKEEKINQENNLIIINKKIHKINSNDKIFKNKSNPLTYQSISKYNSFHKKRINYNEYEEKTKKAKNEDNNNLLLANPNNYINNCNINSIQINLYNNKENSNDLKRKVNYNKNKIITKNISNKNAEKSYDEFNIINKYKTFFNNEFI